MRLIDADRLKRVLIAFFTGAHLELPHISEVIGFLENAPTVDAEPVVRCKDCVHWGKHDDVDVPGETERIKGCEWAFWMIGDNGYCSYGERR